MFLLRSITSVKERTSGFFVRGISITQNGVLCVEGIFFSSSFAAIYWIKKRGLMPGLTLSNEFISRDEALHTEFAIMIYSKLVEKLDKTDAQNIVREAVAIEEECIMWAKQVRNWW